MIKKHSSFLFQRRFYGTTTLGEKGQVVIPSDARYAMNLKKGEKLMVFGVGKDIVALGKLTTMESFVAGIARKIGMVKSVIRRSKKH